MEQIAIERSIWIDASIERTWQTVTSPDMLTQWYATRFKWEISGLKVGGRIKFHNSDTEILHATIEVVDPPHQFRLRWDPVEQGVVLTTAFLLEEENGGTRATISETGYESAPEHERKQWMDSSSGGYALSMKNLKALVEGRSLPH